MTQQNFRRLIHFALAITVCALFSSVALAQYPIGNSHLSDMKPGSVLFFNKYTSNPSNPQQGDTQINITNTNQNSGADIHLFLVDGSTCSIADSFVSLTANQTTSFITSDFDPGVQGYLVAVAVSGGSPTQFNWLIGDEYIRETDGRLANLAAVSIAKRSPGDVAPDGDGTATMNFNDADYERLPASVALSNFNSQATDNTQVNLYVPSSNLIVGASLSTSSIFTLVYDDTEQVFSTTVRAVCYTTVQLSSLRIAGGNINKIVPSGRSGWIRFNGGGKPLLGASIQRGPVFMGGHNLHALSLLPSYSITIPAFGI
ncbi:MAG: hypothetical protein JMDDDDMK_04343 [Acidobacteria bacterium]|nr:hypothetical protein [Acidobacteriota bacterium]